MEQETRRQEELEAKMEAERQRVEAERQRMEAERLQMFEYMRGVYATIGQPPPPMPVPPPQPAPNTFSGTESLYNLIITVSSLCRIHLTKMPRH